MTPEPMLVQIDPDRALVWEDSETLRVGFDAPIARVVAPSTSAQRVIERLIKGVSEDELECEDEPAAAALAALEPALVRSPPRQREPDELEATLETRMPMAAAHRVATGRVRAYISDDGREVPSLRAALETSGLCRIERGAAPPELAVQVIRFLEPLGRTRRWLGDGIPHLIVRFTDDSARVGPLVSGDGAPCHSCEAFHLVDADPALPAMSAQLYGRVPSSESPQTSILVSAVAAHIVAAWLRGETWVHRRQLVFPVAHGAVTGLPMVQEIKQHPECGCAIQAESRPP